MKKSFSEGEMESVLKKHELVLVVFYAKWCGVCKRLLSEVLPSLKEEFRGRADLFLLEIMIEDEKQNLFNQELVEKYRTQGDHPMVIFFSNGREVGREKCWHQQRESVRELIRKVLKVKGGIRETNEVQLSFPLAS